MEEVKNYFGDLFSDIQRKIDRQWKMKLEILFVFLVIKFLRNIQIVCTSLWWSINVNGLKFFESEWKRNDGFKLQKENWKYLLDYIKVEWAYIKHLR